MLKSLKKELLRIEAELLSAHKQLHKQLNERSRDYVWDCGRILDALGSIGGLSSLEQQASETYAIVDKVDTLANLSESMVNEADEAGVDREVLCSIIFGIEALRIDRNGIQNMQFNMRSDNLILLKSEQVLDVIERGTDLLASVKPHFEP